jgi:hypothetical protein
MQVLAALGDAPTAAIAVVAILVGVLLAARGPREKRAAGDAGDEAQTGPTLLKLPAASPAAPEAEPGFVGPQGEIVGHGPIRLGASGPLGGGAPAAPAPAPSAEPEPEPEPEPEREPAPVAHATTAPAPQPEPAPPAPEAPLFTAPPTLPESPPLPQPAAPAPGAPAPDEPPPGVEPAEPKEPAWRLAARAASSAVPFRQGTIKLGGKPTKQDE